MRHLAALAALFAAGCAEAAKAGPEFSGDPSCKIVEEDRAWLAAAPAAWTLVESDVFRLKPLPQTFTYVLFDASCIYTTTDARHWTMAKHGGTITTPDQQTQEPGVVSYVSSSKDWSFMLMSLPSIWRAAGVNDRGGMAPFLTSVFVHEMAHIRQTGELDDRTAELGKRYNIHIDKSADDMVQTRFENNAEFKASVEKERDILLAGFQGDDEAARTAAREALGLIALRQAKWYTADNAGLGELEDIFLTLEGMGGLAGYSWLVHPKGGARTPEVALAQMRTKWWSQEEGLAVMLVVSRLVPDWRQRAFADKPATALELLALAAGGQ